MTLGRYPELTLGKARDKARKARAEIGEGTDPVVEKRAQAASQSVADLIASYLAKKASALRKHTEIARRLNKNVLPIIGDVKLSEFHRRDITRCIDAIVERGAPVEANRVFQDVRAMVRWARGRGDLDSNIAEGMKRPTIEVDRERVLTADEIKTVWEALPAADMIESTRNVLRLCLITGQRVGEISGMTRGELDVDKAIWTLPATRSKNRREHSIPLSAAALEIIAAQIAAVDKLSKRMKREVPAFLFPAPGARATMSSGAVAKAVKRQEKKGKAGGATLLGVEPWTPHDLRRSAATHMEEIGVSPFVIGCVLNHVSTTKASITSRVYARYTYDREKREALDLWADRLTGIITGANVVSIGGVKK